MTAYGSLRVDPLVPFTLEELEEMVAEIDGKAEKQPPNWYALKGNLKSLWAARFSRETPLSIKETAEVLGVSEQTVRLRWSETRAITGVEQLSAESQRKAVMELRHADEVEGLEIGARGQKAITREDLAKLSRTRAYQLAEAISKAEIKSASLRDKAAAFKVFIDAEAILSERPTEIIRHEHRLKLDQLMPAVLLEAKRRGIDINLLEGDTNRPVIDVTPTVEVTPSE